MTHSASEIREILKQLERDLKRARPDPIIRQCRLLASKLRRKLTAALPRSSPDLVSQVSVDLADFWEIGEQLRHAIRKILAMRFPRDTKRLERVLTRLYYTDLLAHLPYHVSSLKRRVPKVLDEIEKHSGHKKGKAGQKRKRKPVTRE